MSVRCLLIGVTGGSASGKSRIADQIAAHYRALEAYVIPEDDYYVDAGNQPGFDARTFNFDEPAAKDHGLLADDLDRLRAGETVQAPLYDFATHCRSLETVERSPAGVIILEGLHVLANNRLARCFDLTIFVDACDTTRLNRRIERDVAERGRTAEFARHQFETLVRPMHDRHVEPQRAAADLVIENMGAPDFARLAKPAIQHIDGLLQRA